MCTVNELVKDSKVNLLGGNKLCPSDIVTKI